MADRKFHKNRLNKTKAFLSTRTILVREKKLIELNYNFIKCNISKNKLTCFGSTKPTEYSETYDFKIIYDGLVSPKAYVVNPEVGYDENIHMYPQDNSLCLFHPETDNFYWDSKKYHVYDTIIPWGLEWFIYYELYQITGKWEHPNIDHRLN